MGTSADAVLVVLDSLPSVDLAMHRLLLATLRNEKLIALRDREIAAMQSQYAGGIAKATLDIAAYTSQIEEYCREHPESFEEGKKSVQLAHGLMGLRASPPSLQPLNDKWTWPRIEAKFREFWKSKYFHKPKPPGLDKAKIKKSLDQAQLKECGLKLDNTETFYLELNRLAVAGEPAAAEAA